MKAHTTIYERGDHKWTVLHKDPSRPNYLIDTNEYLIQNGDSCIMTDPGGTQVFPEIVSKVAQLVEFDKVDRVFCSHQDPDIFSAIALWLQIKPDLKVMLPRIWFGFMMHFGGTRETYDLLPDDGGVIQLNGLALQAVSAHFMHSSGNFNLYDPTAKILFTGDTGAALIPHGEEYLFVEDFDKHIQYIEAFHKRWFGSNEHKNQWCEKVSKLNLDMICPQHGAIYQGENVKRFIDWLYELKVGVINYN